MVRSTEAYDVLPVLFRKRKESDRSALDSLLKKSPVRVHDTIHGQLKELVKSLNPAVKFTADALEEAVAAHLDGCPEDSYGVWVYYPWNNRLVHILDEKEFVALRTDRNLYKITPQERDVLATKKVGVIGLSVGQSVAVTLAMERSFGELRIADMDELEITNLNRLRAGIHNLGIKKTVLVAREIAEIDPFLRVVCFHQGITEENIDAFLLENGKLDVLIDECDGLDIKVLSRLKARQYRIPVLMEASDRATIDVERFDLEPGRSILHGYIDHLDISKIKYLKTSEEKVPYILPIAGVETLSTRMKASMIEVGETISTWPQLASAVSLGGGITADVCRRILTDQYHQSGRYFIDIEELIGDHKKPQEIQGNAIPELSRAAMQHIIRETGLPGPEGQAGFAEAAAEEIVRAAASAPSAGNNQPWKWYFDGANLWLFHELKRSASFGDYKNMAAYVALGAALENARLKANDLGIHIKTSLFPLENSANPVAVLQASGDTGRGTQKDGLSAYIYRRLTNRLPGNNRPIPPAILQSMQAAVEEIPGARLMYLTGAEEMKQMAGIAGASERLRIFIPEGHRELFEGELRWTEEEAGSTRDGIDLATFDLTPTEYIGLRLARDPGTTRLLSDWGAGSALEKLTGKAVLSASAIGLITMPGATPEHFVNGGRAVERMWLTANKNNLSIQPLLATILHFARLLRGNGEKMPPKVRQEFENLYKQYDHIWGTDRKNKTDVFLFRMCFAETPRVKSQRLSLKEVYYNTKEQ